MPVSPPQTSTGKASGTLASASRSLFDSTQLYNHSDRSGSTAGLFANDPLDLSLSSVTTSDSPLRVPPDAYLAATRSVFDSPSALERGQMEYDAYQSRMENARANDPRFGMPVAISGTGNTAYLANSTVLLDQGRIEARMGTGGEIVPTDPNMRFPMEPSTAVMMVSGAATLLAPTLGAAGLTAYNEVGYLGAAVYHSAPAWMTSPLTWGAAAGTGVGGYTYYETGDLRTSAENALQVAALPSLMFPGRASGDIAAILTPRTQSSLNYASANQLLNQVSQSQNAPLPANAQKITFLGEGMNTSSPALQSKSILVGAETRPVVGQYSTWDTAHSIVTPHGSAIQANTMEAFSALSQIRGGATVYRQGLTGVQSTVDAQFWSLNSPVTTPEYANQMGMPTITVSPDQYPWIMGGRVPLSTSVITRPAPGIGTNAGGRMEAVVTPGGVRIDWFHMPSKPE